MKYIPIVLLLFLFFGCENTDVRLATEAGLDAVKAIALSDQAIKSLADQAIRLSDEKKQTAPSDSAYSQRLAKLAATLLDRNFDCRVYLDPEINAFAMANGAIRLNSGLLDMMNDDEVRFVIGHEAGHIDKLHIRKKIQLAYAGRALRKGLAAQNGAIGEIAASELGGFVELLMNAQFSQQEEREADDFGLAILRRKGFNPAAAVSALRKLATLSADHSFLSSHPAPGTRADRLEGQPDTGEPTPIADLLGKAVGTARLLGSSLLEQLQGMLAGG